ncbi:HD-GYP domain-containing protein [Paenibacillus sp. HB172176]|uniref:HD-GYP domain-containing protein n=1 Tax=Paenibacillus sp. HB172176 TaxID=2493690 RepID=UPI001439FBDE|nr:HD-GYP domain-containing protein [Paenibacillus sp. HB172176]
MGRNKTLACFFISMAIPVIGYIGIQLTPYDVMYQAPHGHFFIVSLVSALALALSLLIGVVAVRVRNIKVTFLSLAYVSLAAIFMLHGLSTPGFLLHHSDMSAYAAQLSVLLAAFWLWLCSMSGDRAVVRRLTSSQRWLLPLWCLLLLALGIAMWNNQDFVHMLPIKGETSKRVTTCCILLLNSWTIMRNMQIYLRSRFPLQLAIVYSTGWMFVAQIIMVTGQHWRLSWWLYHILLLASVISIIGGIAHEHLNKGSLSLSIKLLFKSTPQDLIHTYISPSVRELVVATEEKDAYTAGHNYRVALYALKLAEELGLPDSQLKAIAHGGLLHDIGKLNIPDGILNKPGKLSAEERLIIEQHPLTGYELCKRLGFMLEELSVIRSHHEKWNGSGYPDRLAGENIPLVARITAIADVYDALTSSRSYRKAMSHEEAMNILLKESGSHFDPRCMSAWGRLVQEQETFFLDTVKSNQQSRLEL